jgi:hypothetical protein
MYQKNQECELIAQAFSMNPTWIKEQKAEKNVLTIANHGFDLTCLDNIEDLKIVSKNKAQSFERVMFIFSVYETEQHIEIAFVRHLNGEVQPMESVKFSKTK